MMKLFALFLLFSVLVACNPEKKSKPIYKSIHFIYFDISPLSFSVKIDKQDSVFVKQSLGPDNRLQLQMDTTYKSVLVGELKQQLDSLMAVINFSKLDSVYETNHFDGYEYRLNIESDALKKQFKVHSINPPKELEALKDLFLKLRRSLLPADTTTNLALNPLKVQMHGAPIMFFLTDTDKDKYYLANSVVRVFQQGYIGRSPLVSIDGTVFKYQTMVETIVLPLKKSEILNVQFLNKNSSELIYGKDADSGAVIISTTRMNSNKR